MAAGRSSNVYLWEVGCSVAAGRDKMVIAGRLAARWLLAGIRWEVG